ncbi:MAG: T9SS type A sorting domain-containing protein [Prolixibacteraceae bacterium]|nr:T9SS type A sorting domain-containing protein [Prolixibacteraceae bacterium]
MKIFFTLLIPLFVFVSNVNANQKLKEQVEVQREKTRLFRQKAFAFVPKNVNSSNLKSTAATKKMLDKISYPDGSNKTFAYNDVGLLTDYKFYNYDSFSETLELQEHQEIEYDANGNRTLFIDRNLDAFEGFVVVEKEETTYQDNDLPLEQIFWEYEEASGNLIKTMKSVYTPIDGTHFIIEDYFWDETSREWFFSSKTDMEYNDLSHPVSMDYYTYDSDSETFLMEARMAFTYNASGQETQMGTQYISEDSGELEVASTLVTTYDENGNITRETESGSYMGETIVSFENVYTYANGLLIKEEYNSMFGGTYTEYDYTDGKLSEKRDFYEVYNDEYEVIGFSMQYKDQFSYDNSIDVDELVYPFELDTYFSSYADFCDPFFFQFGAIGNTICHSWDYVTESVVEKYRGEYHYSDFNAGPQTPDGITGLTNNFLKISPNPFSDILQITSSSNKEVCVEVYNSSGKVIHRANNESNCIINTSGWEKGLYIVQSQSESYKILKY